MAAQLNRISKLLGLMLIKGENQQDKILTLAAAGFATSEIAELLGIKPNAVAVGVYQSKRKPRKKAARKRAKAR